MQSRPLPKSFKELKTGKLKIRVRALEVERAVERVAVTQDITFQALIATCMANIGCVCG